MNITDEQFQIIVDAAAVLKTISDPWMSNGTRDDIKSTVNEIDKVLTEILEKDSPNQCNGISTMIFRGTE